MAETAQDTQEPTGPADEARDDEQGTGPISAEDMTTEDVPSTPPPLAVLHNVSKRYGDHRAIGPVDLTIERGCVGLLGPNGAGKTTLIRMLMGLLPPTEGTIELLGAQVTGTDEQSHGRIGYVPEGDTRFPGLTGVRAVEYAARLVGMPPADAIQRAHQVLDYVGVGEARYRDASTYSTGMRQRLKIAQALVHDPELLILDEPTEGVDPEAREDILALIAELAREHGVQILLCTHLLHDVERVASHAVVLHRGRVIEHGPIEGLRTAQDRGYQVRVNGATAGLIERLHADGISAEWMGNALRVATQDPITLLAHIEAAGLVVRHMAPIELSLDEVFESAVRRANEAAPEDAGEPTDDDATEETTTIEEVA